MTEHAVGVRELRADLAAMLRRAASGKRVTVSVGGRPTALIGPIESTGATVTADALVAAGLLIPPRRTDHVSERPPVPVWPGVRLDRALREVRG